MARNQEKLKTKMIELLEQYPVVSTACKRAGLPRATYYRWLKEDQDFANRANDAVTIGVDSINDIAETQLSLAIKNGEPWAIRFWLNNRSPHYATPNRLIREIHHTKTMIAQANEPERQTGIKVQFMDVCVKCGESHEIENINDVHESK